MATCLLSGAFAGAFATAASATSTPSVSLSLTAGAFATQGGTPGALPLTPPPAPAFTAKENTRSGTFKTGTLTVPANPEDNTGSHETIKIYETPSPTYHPAATVNTKGDVTITAKLYFAVDITSPVTEQCVTASPASVTLASTSPYSTSTHDVTLADTSITIPQFSVTNCSLAHATLNKKFAGPGGILTLTVQGTLTVPTPGSTTTTTLSVSPASPQLTGTSVTLTATLAGTTGAHVAPIKTTPAATAPAGTMKFYSGTTLLGTQPVTSKTTTYTTTTLPAGTDKLTAVYSGGNGYAGSTSTPPVTYTIYPKPSITVSAPTTLTGSTTTPTPFSITVTNPSDGESWPTLFLKVGPNGLRHQAKADLTFQYQDTAGTWCTLLDFGGSATTLYGWFASLAGTGSTCTLSYSPTPAYFSLASGTSLSINFRIADKVAGFYGKQTIHAQLLTGSCTSATKCTAVAPFAGTPSTPPTGTHWWTGCIPKSACTPLGTAAVEVVPTSRLASTVADYGTRHVGGTFVRQTFNVSLQSAVEPSTGSSTTTGNPPPTGTVSYSITGTQVFTATSSKTTTKTEWVTANAISRTPQHFYDIGTLSVGTHTVVTSYSGDQVYLPYTLTETFTVLAAPSGTPYTCTIVDGLHSGVLPAYVTATGTVPSAMLATTTAALSVTDVTVTLDVDPADFASGYNTTQHLAKLGFSSTGALAGTAAAAPITFTNVTNPTGVGVDAITDMVYVANYTSNTVSVITGTTGAFIARPITVGANPSGVGVDATAGTKGKIYVANSGSNTVSVITGATGALTATTPSITVGTHPKGVAVDTATTPNKIYVANSGSNTVSVITGATGALTATTPSITVGANPSGVGVDATAGTKGKIYVANSGSNTVSVITGKGNTVTGQPITVGVGPSGVGVDATTDKIYVANSGVDSTGTTVSVITGGTGKLTVAHPTVTVGKGPTGVAVNATTDKIYVANYKSTDVSVINGAVTPPTVTSVNLGSGIFPKGVAVNATTGKIYTTNTAGVSVVTGTTVTTVTGTTQKPTDVVGTWRTVATKTPNKTPKTPTAKTTGVPLTAKIPIKKGTAPGTVVSIGIGTVFFSASLASTWTCTPTVATTTTPIGSTTVAGTTLVASPASPVAAGTPVTLTATVQPTPTSSSPSSTVTFFDGTTKLGSAPVATTGPTVGKASLTVTPTVGTHTYRATWSGTTTVPPNTSNTISYSVGPAAPAVTTQPAGDTVNAGQTAAFHAVATGIPAPTVQWQALVPGSATWSTVAGATSTTLTLTAVAGTDTGDRYRAVFTNSGGTATSAPATLTVHIDGYRLVAANGGVFSYGDATFFGSMGGVALNQPIVGTATTPGDGGYWEVASDGGIFSFGNAQFLGSMGGVPLNKPIVGMASTPTGGGYWEVASDGGIFSFGNAQFLGSMGGKPLNKPIVGMAATPTGKGYWLVASDGGIFSFGTATFYGSTGSVTLNKPIVGMAATPGGSGYWLVAADGGVFSFGAGANFYGTVAGTTSEPVVSLVPTTTGGGYWETAADGEVFQFGNATLAGTAVAETATIVGMSQ